MTNQVFTEVLSDSLSFDLIFVKGGTFFMGDDAPDIHGNKQTIHTVKLDSFSTSKYPVTQSLWKFVMGAENNPSYFKGDRRPVEQVSWLDAQDFIKALQEKTSQAYRLPTEAEWEYAARGGQHKNTYLYSGSNVLEEVGWYDENSHFETKDVGLKQPNDLGLYDMSSNVYEWCQDWYSEKYYEQFKQQGLVENPRGPVEGTHRVIRGGSWALSARYCRFTDRYDDRPSDRFYDVGFRLVLPQSVG
ncbi:MAG: formylglycine-generating enzyme family protein, partial [Bacteroidota bacterium]